MSEIVDNLAHRVGVPVFLVLTVSEYRPWPCVPSKNADKPFGQWNRFVITIIGDRVTVVLNGERVIDKALLPKVPRRGAIALQNHADPVEFRNSGMVQKRVRYLVRSTLRAVPATVPDPHGSFLNHDQFGTTLLPDDAPEAGVVVILCRL